MSNVSTFGAFTMAKLGIYASQKAMQVTGNNITNINTKGYTRQSVDLTSLYVGGADRYASKWDAKVGSGVLVEGISQIRSPYMDIRYRTENSTTGMEETLLAGLQDLSRILDEVGKGEDGEGILEASFQDLIEQIQSYNTENSNEQTFDEIMKGSAAQVVDNLNTYARKLEEALKNQEEQYASDVRTVNDILSKIQSLNVSIRKAEIHGSNALELKDERNLLIDDLSHYMRINVMYEEEDVGAGLYVDKLVIKLDSNDTKDLTNDGTLLVNGKYVTQLIVPQLGIPELPAADPDGNVPHYPAGSDTIPYGITLDVLRDTEGKTASEVDGRYAVWSSGPIAVNKLEDGTITANLQNNQLMGTHNAGTDNETTVPIAGATGFTYTLTADAPLAQQLTEYVNAYNQYAEDNNLPWRAKRGTELDRVIFISTEKKPLRDENDAMTVDAPVGAYQVNDGVESIPASESEVILTDTDVYGALQASRELLTEEGEFASQDDLALDPNARSKYGIPYYQKLLDHFAIKFATEMNNANSLEDSNGDLKKDPNGNYIVHPKIYYVTDANGNYLDADGNPIVPTGDADDPQSYKQNGVDIRVVRDQYKGGVLFSNSGDTDDTTGITAKNISIGLSWSTGAVTAMQSRDESELDTSTANSNLRHFVSVLKDNMHSFKLSDVDPNEFGPNGPSTDVEYFKGNFGDMLTKIGSTLAVQNSLCQSRLSNSLNTLNELGVDRDSISGVDLNDEAIAMMQYNKSYSAACRFMTTLDEMLDKLINGTAI